MANPFVGIRSSGVGAALEGGPALDKLLKGLAGPVAKKIVRSAVTKAAHIPLAQIKANAVSIVGGEMGRLIASNLQSRKYRRQRRGSYARFVGLKPNVTEFIHKAKDGKLTYIPAAIEFGHDDVAPIPFVRSAVDAVRRKTERRMFQLITAGILKEARKKMAG